jgi:hypothetical protein
MKKQSNNLFETISNEKAQSLTNLVNETLATGFNHPNSKAFSALDLWNIQRKGTSCLKRRHSF